MSTEAMKLALEALEFNDRRFDIDNYPDKGTIRSVGQEAITALREALAQSHQEPVAWQYRDANDDGTWSAWLGCDKRLVEDEYRQVRALFTSPQPAPVQQEHVAAVAWQQGYDQGVADERISEANIGIAGFNAKVNPARNNPYTAPQPAPVQQEPVAWMHEWEDGEKIPMLKGRDDRNQDKPKTVRPLVYGDTSPQPAQPQQEPVADEVRCPECGYLTKHTEHIGCLRKKLNAINAFEQRNFAIVNMDKFPQPARKPLTDEEKLALLKKHFNAVCVPEWFDVLLLDIEAKHNIKEST